MKIALDKITDQGLSLEEDIDPGQWDVDSFDVHFLNPVHCKCLATRISQEVRVRVECRLRRRITCSRCLDEAEQELFQSFDLYYSREKFKDFLEIDQDIREQLLLGFPMKVLCSQDCKGLCPGCGVNLNKETCRCGKKKVGTED